MPRPLRHADSTPGLNCETPRQVPFKAPQSKNDIEEAGSDEHGPGFHEACFHFGPPFRLRAVRHPSSDAHGTWRHRANFYLPLNFEARGSCVLSYRPEHVSSVVAGTVFK